MIGVDECAQRLDAHIPGEQEEADGNQLLGTPLGTTRATPRAGEQPEHDTAGERLDQAVRPETDQRDRARSKPGADRDREFHHVPGDAAPSEQPRAPLETRALLRRRTRR